MPGRARVRESSFGYDAPPIPRLPEPPMKRAALAMFATASIAALAHARDGGPPKVYVDVAPETPRTEVAVLLVNRPQRRGGDFECAINAINAVGRVGERRHGTGVLPQTGALVVLRPAVYEIGAVYRTHLREGAEWAQKTFEAGKRYAVNCTGRTLNQMKIRAVEIEP